MLSQHVTIDLLGSPFEVAECIEDQVVQRVFVGLVIGVDSTHDVFGD